MYEIETAIDEAIWKLRDASSELDIALTELLGKSNYELESDISNAADEIDELIDQLENIKMNTEF